MYIFKLLLAFCIFQFTCISNAQFGENCYSGYIRGSADQNACNARNHDRTTQERRYKEEQDAKKLAEENRTKADENQRWRDKIDVYEADKKHEQERKLQNKQQETREYERDLERKQAVKQLSSEPTEQQQMEFFQEAIKEMTFFIAIASKPWAVRSKELQKKGKCKESRSLMEKETINADKRTRALLEFMQGTVAEECDKNKIMALTLYARSAENGSIAGKEKLKEYLKE